MDNAVEKLSDTQFNWMVKLVRIIGAVIIVALLLLITGCRKDAVVTPPPVEAKCDAICYSPCVDSQLDTGVRWEGSPQQASTIDALDDHVIPELSGKLRECDTRRKACVKCLDSLETQHIIVQPPHEKP